MLEDLRHCRDEVDGELRRLLSKRAGPALPMMRYQLGQATASGHDCPGPRGKLLRPLLCLLTCEALGGDRDRALPAAAAIELLHNFTLIHDDIQDESPVRRGRPTVWAVWGRAQAINAGDGLYALSHLALLEVRKRGVSPADTLDAIRILGEACLSACAGQSLDLMSRGGAPEAEDYLEAAAGKTGALMACAMELGAVIAGADEASRHVFAAAGRDLGIAFQIRDDRLDDPAAHPLGPGAERVAALLRDGALAAVQALDLEKRSLTALRALGSFMTERSS